MTEMCLLMKYFSCLDGETPWEEVEAVAQRVFHPDLVVIDGKDTASRDEFMNLLKEHIDGGGFMEFLKVEKAPVGVRYELVFHYADGTASKRCKNLATFEDYEGRRRLVKIQRDTVRRAVRVL